MQLTHIAAFTAAAALIGRFASPRWRGPLVLVGSVGAAFWLQPPTPIRGMSFWLPLLTVTLTLGVWLVVRGGQRPLPGLVLVGGVVLLIALGRSVEPLQLTAAPPPPLPLVLAALGGLALLGVALRRGAAKARPVLLGAALVGLLVVLKWPPAAEAAAALLRGIAGQQPQLATPFDLRWLGISYVVFRLLYALQAHAAGKLGRPTLTEFLNYVLFFPSLTAGPIAPADSFLTQWRAAPPLDRATFTAACTRIGVGVFKKYAIADSLALIALNDANALQTEATLWLWVLLYAYALRIFFDFAGYSDVAIGIGMLLGVTLPENFNDPYRAPNIAAFWNRWHISLALWFRALVFNPLTRWLRTHWQHAPRWALIATAQIVTMVLVGVWHGITLNFFIWGAWHGVGLFVHNRYAHATRTQQRALRARPRLRKLLNTATGVITVQFVVLGWVWFALSSTAVSWAVMLRLFGL